MDRKKKNFIAKLIFVAVLLAIILYTFKDSALSIFNQLTQTSLKVIIGVCVSSVIYHMFEAWITFSLARRYTPGITYLKAIGGAFYCSFYRLATLGSGGGVAMVYYLGRFGVGYSEGIGLYMVQYIMHRVSIALFCAVLFLFNMQFMAANYSTYGVYLALAFCLTAVIAFLLCMLIISPKFHGVILRLAGKLNRSGRFDRWVEKLESTAQILETTSAKLLKEKGTLIGILIKDMVKLCFWFGIPFIVLYGTSYMTIPQILAVTSLAVLTASAIPTPSGIGALELIMTAMFAVLVGVELGGAVMILYRFGTFIFPFIVGGIYMILLKVRVYKPL